MRQQKDDSAAHELRDRPVPPVKGAITEPQDLRPRPARAPEFTNARLGDSGDPASWL